MTQGVTDYMPNFGQELINRTMGELLAAFVRNRWPRDTAKQVARAWDLDPSTAANLIKGHSSERTITKALKAEGWPLFMALGRAVTGQTYEQHLESVANEQHELAKRAAARADNLRRLEERARRMVDDLGGSPSL
jgi:hypothetical protein